MKRRIVFTQALVMVVCIMLGSFVRYPQRAQAQTTDKASILLSLNRTRVSSGLAPLAVNPALEKAAQTHSDDMAARGFVDHTGSSGSIPVERISAAGYPAWQQMRVWAENVYAGSHGFSEALDYFLKDETQSRSILSSRYREVGIGAQTATNNAGIQLTYWTLTFGSQPGVLPIFINDGAIAITSPQVAIHLTQEEAVAGGEGNTIGSVIEARVSSSPSFQNATWQRFEPLIPFTFDSLPGPKTVYAQLRDAGGRTVASTASVQYDPNGTPQVALAAPVSRATSGTQFDATRAASPSPYNTSVPIHTVQPAALPGSDSTIRLIASPTAAFILRTPNPIKALNAQPGAQTTGLPPVLINRTDGLIPDWLLPAYLLAQGGVLVAGVYWFLSLKGSPRQ